MKYYTVEGNKKSIFKIFAIYYICMAIFCTIRILATKGYFSSENWWGDIFFSLAVQIITLFIIPLILYCVLFKIEPNGVFERCNYSRVNIATIGISFVLGLLCFCINVAVSSLFSGILTFAGYRNIGGGGEFDYSVGHFFLEVLLVAVLPGLCEEFIHRGVVLQGIKHIGFKKAIVLSSILFGLMHFNINQVAYAIVIGLILGMVAVVSKNIWPAVIIHFTNNFISTYIDYAYNNKWIFGDILEKLQSFLLNNSPAVVMIVSAIVMCIIVALLCLFIWLLYKQTILKKVHNAVDRVYNSSSLQDSHIKIDKESEIKDFLENNTLLNLSYQKKDNPIDLVLPKEKSIYRAKPMDYLFFWGAIVLGGAVTFFTLIWGFL